MSVFALLLFTRKHVAHQGDLGAAVDMRFSPISLLLIDSHNALREPSSTTELWQQMTVGNWHPCFAEATCHLLTFFLSFRNPPPRSIYAVDENKQNEKNTYFLAFTVYVL